jgi:regulator of sigma E protease
MDLLLNVLRVAGLIFLVLLVFNLMIVVHEWGHFLAARWRGLKVEKFYVWFGKAIWKKKINGVEYGLGSIPMGGFVALPQMAPMDAIEGKTEDGREALPPITPLDKIIVAFAGPLFSFLLAAFFAVLVWWVGMPVHEIDVTTTIGYVAPGKPADDAGLKPGDKILNIDGKPVRGFRGLVDSVTWHVVSSEGENVNFLVQRPGEAEPRTIAVKPERPKETTGESSGWRAIFTRPAIRQVGVGGEQFITVKSFIGVEPNNPAQEAGVKVGDQLISLDGQRLWMGFTLLDLVETRVGKEVELGILREGQEMKLKITPRIPDEKSDDWVLVERDKDSKDVKIDNRLDTLGIKELDVRGKPLPDDPSSHPLPGRQLKDAAMTIVRTLQAITSPKSDLGAQHLSGAIGIANVYYNLLQDPDGWRRVLWFSVVLNVNLALLNMLPFPVLDGGHITMALYEWIRRKSINLRVLEVVQTACVVVLFGFMIFISFKDVGDVFGVGRKSAPEEQKKEKVEPKFLPPHQRNAQ